MLCPTSAAAQLCRKVRLPGMDWYTCSLSTLRQPTQITSEPADSLQCPRGQQQGTVRTPDSLQWWPPHYSSACCRRPRWCSAGVRRNAVRFGNGDALCHRKHYMGILAHTVQNGAFVIVGGVIRKQRIRVAVQCMAGIALHHDARLTGKARTAPLRRPDSAYRQRHWSSAALCHRFPDRPAAARSRPQDRRRQNPKRAH